jgi:hypothetical protein
MKEHVMDQLQMRLRRAAVAVFAIGAVAAGTVHAGPSNTVVVVPPTDLSALARPTGEAMLLHETIGGKILPYIEQNQGARVLAQAPSPSPSSAYIASFLATDGALLGL